MRWEGPGSVEAAPALAVPRPLGGAQLAPDPRAFIEPAENEDLVALQCVPEAKQPRPRRARGDRGPGFGRPTPQLDLDRIGEVCQQPERVAVSLDHPPSPHHLLLG